MPENTGSIVLSLDEISKAYALADARHEVLDHLNLTIHKGEFVGIIDIFRRINEAGTSVIMVTHDEDLLFACTAVYRLEGGRLHLLTA